MGYRKKEVPQHFMHRWQGYADLLAKATHVPAALVMRVWPEQIEVLVSSVGDSNSYEEHEMADLGAGLYCETVMATRQMLAVPDALASPEWDHNPDLKLNMVSYLGVPLIWPDDTIFGTVCVLDAQAKAHSQSSQDLLRQLKATIEGDFRAICALPDGGDSEALARRFKANALAMAERHDADD